MNLDELRNMYGNKMPLSTEVIPKNPGRFALKDGNAITPLFQWLKANPAMGAGFGITGAANLGGLFDNDKIGGQLGGGAIGTALPMLANKFLLQQAIGPAGIALSGLTGGAIGSLYDKLRANQDDEYRLQMMSQGYHGGR